MRACIDRIVVFGIIFCAALIAVPPTNAVANMKLVGKVVSAHYGLAGIVVSFNELQSDGWHVIQTATSDANGEYRFPDIPAGEYIISYDDPANLWRNTFYNGFDFDSGITYGVAPEYSTYWTVANVTRMFPLGMSHVRGTVTGYPTNEQLAGIKVRAIARADADAGKTVATAETTTGADGSYDLSIPVDGDFVLGFEDPARKWRTIFYTGVTLPAAFAPAVAADPFTPVEGCDQVLVDAALAESWKVVRESGDNRYSTAIAAARSTWSTAPTVVVCTGLGFADALSASALAGAYDAPILLTPPNALPTGLLDTLQEWKTTDIILVGGTGAISDSVRADLTNAGYNIAARLCGSDRYATSAAVYRHIVAKVGYRRDVFVVRGDAFADALSASPIAWYNTMPVLLVRPTAAPASILSAIHDLEPLQFYLVGGEGAVSSKLLDQFVAVRQVAMYSGRFAGSDRYATAAAVAEAWGRPFDYLGVTCGTNFPDALGGGVVCGARGAALLLTPPTYMAASTKSVLAANAPYLWQVQVFGGPAAVSNAVYGTVVGTVANKVLVLNAQGQSNVLTADPPQMPVINPDRIPRPLAGTLAPLKP